MEDTVVIWHNPACGSSKNALEYLRLKGVEPQIYLYLKEKPNREVIVELLKKLGLSAVELLRPNEKLGEELDLYRDGIDEATVLSALAENAKLIQRPIVIAKKGAVIARPKTLIDNVL
jgi:arsenate reductase (glutaredoxin)